MNTPHTPYRDSDLLTDDYEDYVVAEYDFKGDYEFYRLIARSRDLEGLKREYRGQTMRYLTVREYMQLPKLPRVEKGVRPCIS